jgi:hypothetical protein
VHGVGEFGPGSEPRGQATSRGSATGDDLLIPAGPGVPDQVAEIGQGPVGAGLDEPRVREFVDISVNQIELF